MGSKAANTKPLLNLCELQASHHNTFRYGNYNKNHGYVKNRTHDLRIISGRRGYRYSTGESEANLTGILYVYPAQRGIPADHVRIPVEPCAFAKYCIRVTQFLSPSFSRLFALISSCSCTTRPTTPSMMWSSIAGCTEKGGCYSTGSCTVYFLLLKDHPGYMKPTQRQRGDHRGDHTHWPCLLLPCVVFHCTSSTSR